MKPYSNPPLVGSGGLRADGPSSHGKSNARLTVLAVDDEPQIRRLMSRILNPERFKVTCAAGMEEAVQTALRTEPQVILLDIHLSRGRNSEGIACLRSLRQAGFGNPIYILSADDSLEQAHMAAKFGADGYLVKGEDGFWEKLERLILSSVSGKASPYPNLTAAAVSYLETRGFSDWDMELLSLYADDWTREKEIARITGRTCASVRKHFQLIRDRLGAKSQVDLGRILGVLSCFSERSIFKDE